MIQFDSFLEGKRTKFGFIKDVFEPFGCYFCTNFEYDEGSFDAILHQKGGETIYLRIPFIVVEGELDLRSASILFGKPYVIKHVVNIGLDYDDDSLVTATGLGQFQKPLDTDGFIYDKSRWAQAGKDFIDKMLKSINHEMAS